MRRHGFTLIELLLVAAIIGLLIAIIVPTLRNARRQSYDVVCRHNLHQVDLALHEYAHAQHGWFPLVPFEINPHRVLLDALQAEREGIMDAFYCPQVELMESVAQSTEYPPFGETTSVIDTPENRKAGFNSYLYWSHQDRSMWRSPGSWTGDMCSFRPRRLRHNGALKPFAPSKLGTDEEVEVLPATLDRYWVLSDFFRKKAPFPHIRKHKSGLNVLYLDGHAGWMVGQPRKNFR